MPHLRSFLLVLGVILLTAGAGAAQQKLDAYGDVLPKGATARLGTARGLIGRAEFIALPPDYARLAHVARGNTGVEILSVATGGLMSTFEFEKPIKREIPRGGPVDWDRMVVQHAAVVAAAADGKRLVTWEAGVLVVRETAAGRVVRRLPPPVAPRSVDPKFTSVSADGKLIATGAERVADKQKKGAEIAVTVWDVDRDQQVLRVPIDSPSTHAALLSPDGKLVAGWSMGDGVPLTIPPPVDRVAVRVWEVATGKRLAAISTPARSSPQNVAFSPDGELLAFGYGGGQVEVFDSRTGRRMMEGRGAPAGVLKIAVAPDNKTVAGVGYTGAVSRWSVADGKLLDTTKPDGPVRGKGLAFADAGRVVAWGDMGGSFGVWEAPSGKLLTPLSENKSPVTSIGFRDGGREVVTFSGSGVVRWDAATGKPLGPLMRTQAASEGAGPFGLSHGYISPDGSRGLGLAPARLPNQPQGPARLAAFDPATARGGAEWLAPWTFGNALTAVWTADATRAVLFEHAAIYQRPGAKCVVWDPAANKIVADTMLVLPGIFRDDTQAAVSPDGTRLFTALEVQPPGVPAPRRVMTFNLWDLQSGKELGRVTSEDYFSRMHMTAVNNTTAVFTGRGIHKLDFDAKAITRATAEPVRYAQDIAPAFNPDRTLFAAADLAKSGEPSTTVVRVYEWPSGKLRRSFAGHTDLVTALVFSPDGKTLASASKDNTVLLWDLTTK